MRFGREGLIGRQDDRRAEVPDIVIVCRCLGICFEEQGMRILYALAVDFVLHLTVFCLHLACEGEVFGSAKVGQFYACLGLLRRQHVGNHIACAEIGTYQKLGEEYGIILLTIKM